MAQEEPISLPDPDVSNLTFSEIGYSGLNIVSGKVLEECNYELQWPYLAKTIKEMMKDATIAPSIDYVQTKITNVDWFVKAPKGYEEELKNEVLFLQTIMRDMDHSWLRFIKQAATFVPFGFSAFEIVKRRRLKSRGSNFNDGFIGIKKLALRSQDTIVGWNTTANGRELKSIIQKRIKQTNKTPAGKIPAITPPDVRPEEVEIPISKVLLFRNNPIKDNYLGSTPLAGCWKAWKYKTAYEEVESAGVNLRAPLLRNH